MTDEMDRNPRDWRGPIWLALLVIASVAFSFAFKCAVPFAAFGAVAACTLPRRDAYGLIGAVWLANQGVGFACLNYPWTVNTFAWGAALGITALVSTLAARVAVQKLASVWGVARSGISFLAAYAAYEAALILFSLMLGGIEDHTLINQLRIFEINAGAFVGLLVIDRVGVAAGLAPSFRARSTVATQHA